MCGVYIARVYTCTACTVCVCVYIQSRTKRRSRGRRNVESTGARIPRVTVTHVLHTELHTLARSLSEKRRARGESRGGRVCNVALRAYPLRLLASPTTAQRILADTLACRRERRPRESCEHNL